jgi:hypothetical protein
MSTALMPTQIRWSVTRASSVQIMRIHTQRSGTSTPMSFSTAMA